MKPKVSIKKRIFIIYGVSGSGKSTIGKALASELNIPFYDADDFHSSSNIQKMVDGIPLNDKDRESWLITLSEEIKKWHHNTGAVLACSALKNKYRNVLESIDKKYVEWIYLNGSFKLIKTRLEQRENHFFNPELLSSQFEILEAPFRGVTIDIDNSIDNIMLQILANTTTTKQQLGLIGLGVMGKSLAKNLLSKRIAISVYNRQLKDKEVDVAKTFVIEQSNSNILGFDDMAGFVNSIEIPRTIILMVNAGQAVDTVLQEIQPYLDKGDCIIDGGNSHYKDTERRQMQLKTKGIDLLGMGISGGEKGALNGPSIMPGGSASAYSRVKTYLEAIAAKDNQKKACCTYIGNGSCGHFVKMVHNGIEYAQMQLIAEIYHLLRWFVGYSPEEIAVIFESWRTQSKDSYLLEITSKILKAKEGDFYLIDLILDKAGQKGTGSWTVSEGFELGVAVSNISASVDARILSYNKNQRISASNAYNIDKSKKKIKINIDDLEKAYEIASICNHHMGFDLIQKAGIEKDWDFDLSEIARIWTNGCIIRSELMEELSLVFKKNSGQQILMFPEITSKVMECLPELKSTVAAGLLANCPLPVLSSSINYILTYISEQTSASMIQAQRDFFGAHTYQRVDQPWDQSFHTNWENS